MTEPTDADRKHAAELIWGNLPREQVEAVARARAEERAKFLALADEIENESDPGLSGEALDAWNAATMRASQIVRAADTTP